MAAEVWENMSEVRRRRGAAPWISAAVAGAAAIVLAVVLLVPLRHAKDAPVSGLSSREQSAMTAASQEVVNLLTYTRKNFDADFQRALSGMTGALLSDQQKLKDQTKTAMAKNKVDLKGEVAEVAYSGTDDAGNILVLVSAAGYQVPESGTPLMTTNARFEITMNRIGGKWLASNLQNVGLS